MHKSSLQNSFSLREKVRMRAPFSKRSSSAAGMTLIAGNMTLTSVLSLRERKPAAVLVDIKRATNSSLRLGKPA
jgi:hypothetical protein